MKWINTKTSPPKAWEEVLGAYGNGEIHVVYMSDSGKWGRSMDQVDWQGPELWSLLPPHPLS